MTIISQLTDTQSTSQNPLDNAVDKMLHDTGLVLKVQFEFIKQCILGPQNKESSTLEGRIVEALASLPSIAIFIALDAAFVCVMMPALFATYCLENQLNIQMPQVNIPNTKTAVQTKAEETMRKQKEWGTVRFSECGFIEYDGWKEGTPAKTEVAPTDSDKMIKTIVELADYLDPKTLESDFQEFHKETEHPCESEENCRLEYFAMMLETTAKEE